MPSSLQARIRRPASEKERKILYRRRAEVFFGEGVLAHGASPSLSDNLDAAPNVINLIAVTTDGSIVGGGRVAFPAEGFIPSDSPFFSFNSILPAGSRAACGSMLWVDPAHRRSRLAAALVRAGITLSAAGEMSHLCIAARPTIADYLISQGWTKAAEEFIHPVEEVPVVPLIFDLADQRIETEDSVSSLTEIHLDHPSDLLHGLLF